MDTICRHLPQFAPQPSLRGSDLSKCRLVGPTSLEAGLEIVLNRAVSARVGARTPPAIGGREGRTAWMRMAIDTAAKIGPRARPGRTALEPITNQIRQTEVWKYHYLHHPMAEREPCGVRGLARRRNGEALRLGCSVSPSAMPVVRRCFAWPAVSDRIGPGLALPSSPNWGTMFQSNPQSAKMLMPSCDFARCARTPRSERLRLVISLGSSCVRQ